MHGVDFIDSIIFVIVVANDTTVLRVPKICTLITGRRQVRPVVRRFPDNVLSLSGRVSRMNYLNVFKKKTHIHAYFPRNLVVRFFFF